MMLRLMYSVVLFPWVAALSLAAPPNAHKGDALSDTPPTVTESDITVERIDPRRVAFLLHKGAYWTIGPEFVRVREHMKAHDQPGPLFVRYQDDPRTTPPQTLYTEIGFFIDGEQEPGPPYQTAHRDSELVARMRIDGPFASISRHFAMLHAWAKANDFVATGPITEIYPETDRQGDRVERIELQMVIEPRSEPIDQTTPTSRETPIGEVPGPRAAEAEAAATSLAQQPRSRPDTIAVSNESPHPTVAEPADRGGKDADAQDTPPGETARPATNAIGTEDPDPVRSDPSIRELAVDQRFDRIAEAMLPGGRNYSPNSEVWLGHVVFRFRAIARGIEQAHPDDSAAISALSGAIDQRLEQVSGFFTLKPLDHLVVPSSKRRDPDAAEKRAILHDLDVLMARIGLESIDASTAFDQLLEAAQQTANLMDSSRQ